MPQATFGSDDLDSDDDESLVSMATADELLKHQINRQQHGKRLDVVLAALAPSYSRNHLQSLVERGLVSLGGQVVTQAAKKVQLGQWLQATIEPTAQTKAFTPEPMNLPVVYEDEHLLVIDKPAGWVVHPAAGHWSGTLMNGLLAHHAQASHLPRAGIVHRLDKDTSGLMVVGKTLATVTALTRLIAERQVHRQYAALVWGQPGEHLAIDAPIGRDPQTRVKMAVVAGGKPARTDVKTLASLPVEAVSGGAQPRWISAVECVLHTGRTHQIRVHLSQRGYPLLADKLYGGREALGLQRQALHAQRLEFVHPVTAVNVSFQAPLPADLQSAWDTVVT